MPVAAIVFDFDGVIVNSEPLHYRALRDVVGAHGIALAERDYYARYLGYDDVGALRAIAVDHGVTWKIDEIAVLVDRKAERLAALERDASLLFPGAVDAIRRFTDVVPLAIASGALRDEITRVLEAAGLTHAFSAIVAAEDTPASKPAPDPYARAIALLSDAAGVTLEPGHCVAVEDSRWGIQSAHTAGLRVVAVTHTYSADELKDADLVVETLDKLTPDAVAALCGG